MSIQIPAAYADLSTKIPPQHQGALLRFIETETRIGVDPASNDPTIRKPIRQRAERWVADKTWRWDAPSPETPASPAPARKPAKASSPASKPARPGPSSKPQNGKAGTPVRLQAKFDAADRDFDARPDAFKKIADVGPLALYDRLYIIGKDGQKRGPDYGDFHAFKVRIPPERRHGVMHKINWNVTHNGAKFFRRGSGGEAELLEQFYPNEFAEIDKRCRQHVASLNEW